MNVEDKWDSVRRRKEPDECRVCGGTGEQDYPDALYWLLRDGKNSLCTECYGV